jgi:hypothetical protein
VTFKPVAMASGEDWVMRPVLRGLCRYESLIDGTLDLFDVARMNEAIDVNDENERRINDALAKKEQ